MHIAACVFYGSAGGRGSSVEGWSVRGDFAVSEESRVSSSVCVKGCFEEEHT